MKTYPRNSLFFAALLTLTATAQSCEWNSDLYDTFVREDNSILQCPNLSEDPDGVLLFIEKLSTNDDTLPGVDQTADSDKVIRCAKECSSELTEGSNKIENCVPLTDSRCAGFKDALEHSICPKTKRCLPYSDKSYYCSAIVLNCNSNNDCSLQSGWTSAECRDNKCVATACNEEAHLVNNTCVIDTEFNCGSAERNCFNEIPNASAIKCVIDKDASADSGKTVKMCQLFQCEKGYHIEGNTCAKDNETNCGGINCTLLSGWQDGSCDENVQCHSTACTPGWHPYNKVVDDILIPCDADTDLSCGSMDTPCESGEGEIRSCHQGSCVLRGCSDGYHKATEDGKEICRKDSQTECGSIHFDCTKLSGVDRSTVSCSRPTVCYDPTCNLGFHSTGQEGLEPCEADTNYNCGKHGNKCPADKPVCTFSESSAPKCDTVCDEGLTLCDNGCYDTMTSVTHCGTDTVCGVDCTVKHPDANVDCVAGSCVITTCKTGYHLNDDKSACVPDTIDNCGGSNCNASIPSNAVVSSCNQGQCLYECKEGYTTCDGACINLKEKHLKSCGVCESGYENCDLNNQNGCETNLDDYGLKSCTTCASPYMGCGNTTTKLGLVIPLCLAQGNYYKNYEGDAKELVTCYGDTKFEYYKYYNNETAYRIGDGPLLIEDQRFCYDSPSFINYEYKDYDVQTGFKKAHYYKLIKNKWDDKKYTWTAEHCALACNSNRNITGEPNGKHTDANGQTIEAWSHQCAPKQACDQFDSFEVSVDTDKNNHFFFDYGCQY